MRTLLAVMMVVLLSGPCWSANYFIDPQGSNSNNGTSSATPWLTFAFAIDPLRASCGDTLIMAPGNYGDDSSPNTGKIFIDALKCAVGDELTITQQIPRQGRIYDN